ncbi:unnamed protein product [Urochloa humidicola]
MFFSGEDEIVEREQRDSMEPIFFSGYDTELVGNGAASPPLSMPYILPHSSAAAALHAGRPLPRHLSPSDVAMRWDCSAPRPSLPRLSVFVSHTAPAFSVTV